MREAGLEVLVDPFGNIFGRRQGYREAPSVMTGSHIDGPPRGGIYDGTIGVLGGIECMRLFNELGLETEYPIEIAVLACEHLDRFGMGCLGSRAVAGRLKNSYLTELTDQNGVTLREALESAGLKPDKLGAAQRSDAEIRAYLELHIEQGPVLEKLGKKIGVVTSISGPTRMEMTIEGETNHSGGTPMGMRHDALAAASEIVLAIEACARAEQEYGTVGTVGVIEVEPGSMVAIPGRAQMLIDIRGVDWQSKRRVLDCIEKDKVEIARRRDVAIDVVTSVDEKPVNCSREVVDIADSVCREKGIECWHMASGGGHDAQHIADITKSGMIFVPSVKGISHAPAEYTQIEDICIGISVLAGSIWCLSNSILSW
jgi:hydantoinase/carbamoylase family amidase